MSDKDLSRKPHNTADDSCWWYDEPSGILIVKSINVEGKFVRTDQVVIPWRSIRAALTRKDKP